MSNEKLKGLPTQDEILKELATIKVISNPIEMNARLTEVVENLAKIIGVFYTELMEFEQNTYQAVVQNSMEINSCIYALTKRGLLTNRELDEAFKEVDRQVKAEQEEKAKQHKEKCDEGKETGNEAGSGIPPAGSELRGDKGEAGGGGVQGVDGKPQ